MPDRGNICLRILFGGPGQTTFVDGKEIYYTGGVFTPPSIQRGKHRAGHGTSPLPPAEAAKAASAFCS